MMGTKNWLWIQEIFNCFIVFFNVLFKQIQKTHVWYWKHPIIFIHVNGVCVIFDDAIITEYNSSFVLTSMIVFVLMGISNNHHYYGCFLPFHHCWFKLIMRVYNVQCFQMFFMFCIHQSHDFVYSQLGCLNLWKRTSIENY